MNVQALQNEIAALRALLADREAALAKALSIQQANQANEHDTNAAKRAELQEAQIGQTTQNDAKSATAHVNDDATLRILTTDTSKLHNDRAKRLQSNDIERFSRHLLMEEIGVPGKIRFNWQIRTVSSLKTT